MACLFWLTDASCGVMVNMESVATGGGGIIVATNAGAESGKRPDGMGSCGHRQGRALTSEVLATRAGLRFSKFLDFEHLVVVDLGPTGAVAARIAQVDEQTFPLRSLAGRTHGAMSPAAL